MEHACVSSQVSNEAQSSFSKGINRAAFLQPIAYLHF